MKRIFKFFILLLVLTPIVCLSSCKKCKKDKEVKIVSISVVENTVPSFIYIDELDQKLNDIKIKVVKSDDSTEEKNLTKEMLSASDYAKLANEGTYTVKITYEGFETSLNLTMQKKGENIQPDDPTKVEYNVIIDDIAGKPLSNFYVTFYLGDEIVAEGYTKANGFFTTSLDPNIYDVLIEGREGYYLNQEMYQTDLLGSAIEVTCELDSLAGKEAEIGHLYEIGDVMYDFTVTDTDDNDLNLYELLEEYKVVILNFWFTTCSYCAYEFPAMVEAYESTHVNGAGETVSYQDDVVIIAVNPMIAGNGDSLASITNYKYSNNITFNVAPDYDADPSSVGMEPALTTMFGITGYPTTVIIDRFGLIAQIEEGAQTSPDKWMQTFDKYIADDYFPVFTGAINEGTEMEKPNIQQADSSELEAAANGTNYDGTKFECTYRPEDNEDKEYSWPWVVTTYKGQSCLMPSNQDKHPSFAIVYFDVILKAGEAFAFDYFASSEDYDALYVTFDDTIVASISGQSSDWETNYTFVALEDGSYEVGFCYLKDSSYNGGEDSVYVRNLRIIEETDIDQETYIFRECATGQVNELTMSYPNYVKVVFNEEDGYYHVNTKNGPLLLADLLSGTKWNNSDLYSVSLEGLCIGLNGVDYNALVEEYAVYASNSSVGYAPVTEELANALKEIAKALGHEDAKDNPNQWLELCVYYNAYGTNGEEMGLPTVGVCYFEPIMFDGDAITEPATASAEFNRVILPRGFIFGFTPTKSGAYKFYSTGNQETSGWICDEEAVAIAESEMELREIYRRMTTGENLDPNFACYMYLEAGQTYLFRGAFYDVTVFDTINVEMAYIGENIELLTLASPGYFTSSDAEMADIISGNYIDVELGADGYYHVKGSHAADNFVYCDVEYINGLTGVPLSVAASDKYYAFDFNKDEFGERIYDEEGYYRVTVLDEEGNKIRYYVCTDAEGNEYYVLTVGEGEYTEANGYTYIKRTSEMDNADFTEYVLNYIAENKITDETSELYGCVKVDKKFADVLWLYMNKYTFAGIEGSWLKLCYYYKYVGPVSE